jgi:hypothetical protein
MSITIFSPVARVLEGIYPFGRVSPTDFQYPAATVAPAIS